MHAQRCCDPFCFLVDQRSEFLKRLSSVCFKALRAPMFFFRRFSFLFSSFFLIYYFCSLSFCFIFNSVRVLSSRFPFLTRNEALYAGRHSLSRTPGASRSSARSRRGIGPATPPLRTQRLREDPCRGPLPLLGRWGCAEPITPRFAFEGFRGPGCAALTGRETGLPLLAAPLSPPSRQEGRNGESRARSPNPATAVCAAPRGSAEAVPGPSGAGGFRVRSEGSYSGPGVGSGWA